MILQRSVRGELVQTVTVAWIVGAIGGTVISVIGLALFRGFLTFVMLPLMLPLAVIVSALGYLPILLAVIVFPGGMLRHKAIWTVGVPIVVALASYWPGGFTSFPFGADFSVFTSIIGAAIAGGWCHYFTGHLDDRI